MHRMRLFIAVALTSSFMGIFRLQADSQPLNFPTPVQDQSSITGLVTNIDPVNRMIQLTDDNGMIQKIRVNDRVQITRHGNTVKLVNLKLGDFVTVTGK